MYLKFLIFKLPNVSNKDALSIRKRLLRSAINNRSKELRHVSKELSQSETFLSKQLSATDFYILKRSIASHNKKLLQKSLNTQQKKLSSLTRNCRLPTFTSNETIASITQYELSQEESDLLKEGLYFSIQPNKIRKTETSLPSKRFIVRLSTALNPRKLKIREKDISRILPILISTTAKFLHVYHVNIASYETLEKIKISS